MVGQRLLVEPEVPNLLVCQFIVAGHLSICGWLQPLVPVSSSQHILGSQGLQMTANSKIKVHHIERAQSDSEVREGEQKLMSQCPSSTGSAEPHSHLHGVALLIQHSTQCAGLEDGNSLVTLTSWLFILF